MQVQKNFRTESELWERFTGAVKKRGMSIGGALNNMIRAFINNSEKEI
jgi:hypothetical protein